VSQSSVLRKEAVESGLEVMESNTEVRAKDVGSEWEEVIKTLKSVELS